MWIKLQFLFVAYIIVSLASGRPDMPNTELNPVDDSGFDPFENTELIVNGTSEREKREECGWTYGCHKGYCYSNCRGGIGILGK